MLFAKGLRRTGSHYFRHAVGNFDNALCKLFGERLTLSNDLSLALQFGKLNIEQSLILNKYEIPSHIAALDAHLIEGV